MSAAAAKRVRCAIYTRVSTEYGLEQDFNSLDAQYEASSAYIRSQAHAGWSLLRERYDDGGFSGGSTDRPALQRLLDDIRAEKLDVIVVYKVDRLTRSLADFAKLVELFDKHNVSFVSVTQQFNTTTSMGRLTLNVLLSFAQFEREVTSERIRDKIAASKRKGLWVGGMTPLGYDTKDRKITVNKVEAERVHLIFRNYLKVGSIDRLLVELRHQNIRTKQRKQKTGKTVGGIPFTRGPLAHLLRNRFYIGEVNFKGEILKGEQPAIIDKTLFTAVQKQLNDQTTNQNRIRRASGALLAGRIYDDHGNKMSPTYSRRRHIKHRYYLSLALVQGRREQAGTINRIPADEVETIIIQAVRKHLKPNQKVTNKQLIETLVRRIDVQPRELIIHLAHPKEAKRAGNKTLRVAWAKTPLKKRHEIMLPATEGQQPKLRPIRSENRAVLITAIVRGRRWLDELVSDPKASPQTIATREQCTPRKVNMTISLAFLAPSIVKAAVEGRLPFGTKSTSLSDGPVEWSRQDNSRFRVIKSIEKNRK